MKEFGIVVACWIGSGIVGWILGMIVDRMFYIRPKFEWGVFLLCVLIGPLTYLVILRSLLDAFVDNMDKRDGKKREGKTKDIDMFSKETQSQIKATWKLGDELKSSRPIRTIIETDKCDWCGIKKAVITDGSYVYCSDECKKLYLKNASEAIEENHG